MPDNFDRRIGNRGGPMIALALMLILAVAAGLTLWFRMPEQQPDSSAVAQGQTGAEQAIRPDEPVAVTLFIPGQNGLTSASASVKRQPDSQSQAREALNAVFSDSRTAKLAVLKDVTPRSFFLDETGTAYVDLSPLTPQGAKASAQEELFALYAIVNTLVRNFEEIKQVRFLVDGREDQSVAGHVDLSGPFTERPDLVRQ